MNDTIGFEDKILGDIRSALLDSNYNEVAHAQLLDDKTNRQLVCILLEHFKQTKWADEAVGGGYACPRCHNDMRDGCDCF